MSGRTNVIVLAAGVCVQDVIRALRGSDLGMSNSEVSPQLYVIKPLPQRWPANVIPLSALLRPQAE